MELTKSRTRAQYMITVMQHFLDGGKVEYRSSVMDGWAIASSPTWSWDKLEYRIKPETPDYINWDHVAPQWKWMARGSNGTARLFTSKPTVQFNIWGNGAGTTPAQSFASFRRGTMDWENSLVERPTEPSS